MAELPNLYLYLKTRIRYLTAETWDPNVFSRT